MNIDSQFSSILQKTGRHSWNALCVFLKDFEEPTISHFSDTIIEGWTKSLREGKPPYQPTFSQKLRSTCQNIEERLVSEQSLTLTVFLSVQIQSVNLVMIQS
jgi:hypothetical protein